MTYPTTTHRIEIELLNEEHNRAKKRKFESKSSTKSKRRRTDEHWLQNAELCCLKLDLHVICTRSFRLNNDVTPIGCGIARVCCCCCMLNRKTPKQQTFHDNEKRQNRSMVVISIILFALAVISFSPSIPSFVRSIPLLPVLPIPSNRTV